MLDWHIILALIAVGSCAGFLAGLLGVGGGMLVVPIVLWTLKIQGIETAHSQHLAIGTSFAVMVFTSFSSMMAHYRNQAVNWHVVRYMAPMMVIGTVFGSVAARFIPGNALLLFFILFIYTMSVQILLNFKPKATRRLPDKAGLSTAGSLFGTISSWIGIGGSSLTVPFMLYCNIPIHEAVGTSAALGWSVAISGSISFLISGWSAPGLPNGSFGFWYLPAAVVLAATTVWFAPLGVRAAHRLPPDKLKRVFGSLLFAIASAMLYEWLTQ
ncbi:sulfite exporter TauE/SafE family protein [Stenoxybacter acetivorans]|uniref:sulfite exporter TauE/SafE family protein n=1 Tax=Stenoxybacter acetivorans TaxID=422441 RepID=UPI0005604D68|nr:sulfite exporter TauE/SafE family protein [Stenoxybacter acetivorans]